jgi:cytoskeletal protein RodZ
MVKKPITTPNFDDSPTTGAANQEAGSAKANKPASVAKQPLPKSPEPDVLFEPSGEAIEATEEKTEEQVTLTPYAAAKVPRESLNKIVTNDQTPRCAFCESPRIERMPNANFLKWRCNDCRRHFREPVTARRSA